MINLFESNEIIDSIEISSKYLSLKNGESQHNVSAIGHCHIDIAWLWPYSETRRKIARSWSTQINLMNKYPTFKFIQSQPQLYEWFGIQKKNF